MDLREKVATNKTIHLAIARHQDKVTLGRDITFKLNKFQYRIHFISHINEMGFLPIYYISLTHATHKNFKSAKQDDKIKPRTFQIILESEIYGTKYYYEFKLECDSIF